ncbi:MAG TPA: hypothetical protein VI795_01925 [Patescibacteria group bacterium]|nr:hypothetical protein [Patescibacteria group bacterium]
MKNIKGQSLFEVILAIFIITLIVVAVVILSTNSISNSLASRNKTLASKYTQEAIEWLRKQKESDYIDFKEKATPGFTYCLIATLNWNRPAVCGPGQTIDANSIFRREVSFSKEEDVIDKYIIIADVVTYWDDSKGRHEARSITYFSDAREQ